MDINSTRSLIDATKEFIHLGMGLVSKANESYSDKALRRLEMEPAIIRLSLLRTQMKTLMEDNESWTQWLQLPGIRTLYRICVHCIEFADTLIEALKTLQQLRPALRYKSLRQGLKSLWTKDTLDEFRLRLNMERTNLDHAIAFSLRCVLYVGPYLSESKLIVKNREILVNPQPRPDYTERDRMLERIISDAYSRQHTISTNGHEKSNLRLNKFPLRLIFLFLLGIIVLALYTWKKHDLGTATGLCALVWTVGAGVNKIYKRYLQRGGAGRGANILDLESAPGSLA